MPSCKTTKANNLTTTNIMNTFLFLTAFLTFVEFNCENLLTSDTTV